MNNEKKEFIRSIAIYTSACAAIIGGFALYEKLVGFNTPNTYNKTATVIYDDKEYLLKELYKVSSDEETHLCILEKKSHSNLSYGITPEGKFGYIYTTDKDPNVYVDIKTNKEIAIEGYESIFGYNVEKLINYFPYEEYGSKEKVRIPQEKIDEVIKEKNKSI